MFAQYEPPATTDIGAVRMIRAVMTRAGKDYLQYLKHEKRLRDKDKGLSTKRILYGGKYRKLYGYQPIYHGIKSLEEWFTSDHAMLFDEYVNPLWLMQTIKREVGL